MTVNDVIGPLCIAREQAAADEVSTGCQGDGLVGCDWGFCGLVG